MALGIVLCLSCTTSIHAAIIWSGDVNPLDPNTWTSGTRGYVGETSTGTIYVDDGSVLLSNDDYLGYGATSLGTATITGAGSKWITNNSMHVGYYGSGVLNIEAGGEVNCTNGDVGLNAGSIGTATVTGTNSKWTCSRVLNIGYLGSGNLTVNDGGTVSSTWVTCGGHAGSQGSSTVIGSGSKWNNSGTFYVGVSGSGTLCIEAGAEVSNSSDVYLGRNSGAAGQVTVAGTGSKFTCNGNFYVGTYGSGTLTVSDGGTVQIDEGLFATGSSLLGNGTISTKGGVLDADLVFDATHGLQQTISFGTGGTLNLIPNGLVTLGVGYNSNGSLTIAQGKTVTSLRGYLGYHSGSTGTATITGSGSKWTLYNELVVGLMGTGTLKIENGAQVIGSGGILGATADSVGSVTVTGAGSKWSNGLSPLTIGLWDNGVLTVTDGGTVTLGTISASMNSLLGNGTITANGAVLDADLVFDAAHKNHNTLVFGSGGTLDIYPWKENTLGAGFRGNGTLKIAEGIVISSSSGNLGNRPGSNGIATVTGAATKWNISGVLAVGLNGNGILNIDAGGQVNCTFSHLGEYADSSGTATVAGADSKWSCTDELHVGGDSNGTLNIGSGSGSGGLVMAKSLFLADEVNSNGQCNLNGGKLQAEKIVGGNGTTQFDWSDGTIQNYDAMTDLTISGSLALKLAATGSHVFNIDADRTATVDAVLCDATSGGTLTKAGQGTLVLTGANTYSGDTSVEEGTLSIRVPYLNDFVGVRIASGAKFDLNFLGSDTVGSLYLDSLPVALGSWGSSSSSATFIDDVHFSGTGMLNVVPEPSTLVLLGMGAFGLLAWGWQRSRKAV